jgi:hypothetical protein
MSDECIRRKRFKWNNFGEEKVLLKTPKLCNRCEEEKLKGCMEQSWAENGRNTEDYASTTIVVNVPEATHVDVNPTEIHEDGTEE